MDIRKDIYEDEMKRIEEDILPFGFSSTVDDQEPTSFYDGEDYWRSAGDSSDTPFL
jgi:hypothetical protein